MNLIGDVKGKVAVMVDDMIDTAGELSFPHPRFKPPSPPPYLIKFKCFHNNKRDCSSQL